MKIYKSVQDGNDVVYTENEGVQHASAAKSESEVQIVELAESEENEGKQNKPRLVSVELVVVVDDCPYE